MPSTGRYTVAAAATPADPWSQAPAASGAPASDPWGAAGSGGSTPDPGWLSTPPAHHDSGFSLLHPFHDTLIPLQHWVEQAIDWLVSNFRPFFNVCKAPVDATLSSIAAFFSSVPPLLLIALFGLIAWQLAGKRRALGTVAGLLVVGGIGAWPEAMVTLSLVLTSVVFCMCIGIPVGIFMGYSDRANRWIRPVLDAMQTTPAFVYLVPIVMLFGIGNVPGVVVTIIFAVPPLIRLTNLGIRQVPADLVEAAHSFGADPWQMLCKVQFPLALPTIMAGVNQTLMLCLSMVVIASMISVGGLGLMVLRGIGRLDIGLAAVGGLGIVILAVILDRITQALGQDHRARGARHWYEAGPVGLLCRAFRGIRR